jgi:hypothetical protein
MCESWKISRGPGAKCNFNSNQVLMKFVKSLENRRKIRKMQTHIS